MRIPLARGFCKLKDGVLIAGGRLCPAPERSLQGLRLLYARSYRFRNCGAAILAAREDLGVSEQYCHRFGRLRILLRKQNCAALPEFVAAMAVCYS